MGKLYIFPTCNSSEHEFGYCHDLAATQETLFKNYEMRKNKVYIVEHWNNERNVNHFLILLMPSIT